MNALILTLTVWLQTWMQPAQQDPSRFNNFLLLAYGVMWLVVIVYVINLANKQRNLHQEIRLMRRLLKEDEDEV